MITEFTQFIEDLSKAAGALVGLIAGLVLLSEKIARLIPTNFKCKPLQRVARFFYGFFAILGAKVPDVAKIEDGKIITNIEAVAQETINKNSTVEPK